MADSPRARLRRGGGERLLGGNQFTVVENRHERGPDIVLFVNGLPLGVSDGCVR